MSRMRRGRRAKNGVVVQITDDLAFLDLQLAKQKPATNEDDQSAVLPVMSCLRRSDPCLCGAETWDASGPTSTRLSPHWMPPSVASTMIIGIEGHYLMAIWGRSAIYQRHSAGERNRFSTIATLPVPMRTNSYELSPSCPRRRLVKLSHAGNSCDAAGRRRQMNTGTQF